MSIKNLSDNYEMIAFTSDDVSADASKGDYVVVNNSTGLSGFYADDIENTESVTNSLNDAKTGVFLKTDLAEYDKTTSETFSKGDKIYYNTSTGKATSTNTHVHVGYAHEAGASADTLIKGSFSGYVSGEVN